MTATLSVPLTNEVGVREEAREEAREGERSMNDK